MHPLNKSRIYLQKLIIMFASRQNIYYPFGLIMKVIGKEAAGGIQNKYMYNGKEIQNKEFSDGSGLKMYDYGARMYDVQIGRWHIVDPMADSSRRCSPFVYCDNNPIRNVDVDGMYSDFYNEAGAKVDHIDDGSNAVFRQTGKGTDLHYEFKGEYSNQGGKNEITDKAVTSVEQKQQELNIGNPSLQPGAGGDVSHCNQALHNVQEAVGSALGKDIVTQGRANDIAGKNGIATNSNYQKIDATGATKSAGAGKLVVVAYQNPLAGHSGHVATMTVGSNISKGSLANVGYSKGVTNFVNPTGTAANGYKDAAFKKSDWNNNVSFYILKR